MKTGIYRDYINDHVYNEAKKSASFMGLKDGELKAFMAGASFGQCKACQLLGIKDKLWKQVN